MEAEKNTYISFQRVFEDGFGIETDLRDYMVKKKEIGNY